MYSAVRSWMNVSENRSVQASNALRIFGHGGELRDAERARKNQQKERQAILDFIATLDPERINA